MKLLRIICAIAILTLLVSCETNGGPNHGYCKIKIYHDVDSSLVPGAQVSVYGSSLYLNGLSDANGGFEFTIETNSDTIMNIQAQYTILADVYTGNAYVLIEPGDTTFLDLYCY